MTGEGVCYLLSCLEGKPYWERARWAKTCNCKQGASHAHIPGKSLPHQVHKCLMSEEAQGTRAHWARASCIATIILPNEPHAQPHNWVLFSGELRSPVLGKMVCCSCEAQACMGNYSATQESRESVLCDLAPRVAVTRIKTAWVAGHVPQIAMVHSTELGTQIIYFIHLSGPAVLSKRGSECAHRKMAGFHWKNSTHTSEG